MSGFGPGELQMAVLKAVHDAGRESTAGLAVRLGISAKRASKAASALVLRGYLVRIQAGLFKPTSTGTVATLSGKAITSGPIDADANVLHRAPTYGFRDRLWQSMRMRVSFTLQDIVSDAVDTEVDAINDASRYIRILKGAGYVRDLPGRVAGTRPGSNGYKRFRLVKNTGPRAPLHRSKRGLIHDFNTGEDVSCAPR